MLATYRVLPSDRDIEFVKEAVPTKPVCFEARSLTDSQVYGEFKVKTASDLRLESVGSWKEEDLCDS